MGWYNHKPLPRWIERSSFLKNLLLFRKIYLTRLTKKFYGQEAEDIALRRIFPPRPDGFFVDVGCFHPIKYNNTFFLYKRGWRGINIDIDPIKIKGFNWVRKEDTNVAMAVSDRKGEINYWTNGFYSLVNTLEPGARHPDYDYLEKTAKTDTLTNIIDATKYKNRQIDLLTIDAEGFDFVVLQSLDFERYQPKVIVIEAGFENIQSVLQSELYKYLSSRNYDVVNWTGLSLIFRRNNIDL